MGLLAMGTSCLALVWVMGRSRVPRPPLRMSAFIRQVLAQSLLERLAQPGNREADLGHVVPRAERDRLLRLGLEVDRDAVRRPDLVLAPVALADRLRVVVLGAEERSQLVLDPMGSGHQRLFPAEGKDGDLDRRDRGLEGPATT